MPKNVTLGRADLIYVLIAVPALGLFAWLSARGMVTAHPGSDIWQHAAALLELMENPQDPANPFVVSSEGSRHFHPLWLGWTHVARVFSLDVWQVLAAAGYVAMVVFGVGVYVFARALHRSVWAPVALLSCLLLGWALPIQHTGFHSPFTLYYAAAYPATYLIGMSFILWAVTLRGLTKPVYFFLLLPLALFMFTTHQLGAVIGFIGAACFAVSWPHGSFAHRIRVLSLLAIAVSLSTLWPYFNAVEIVLRPGNASWTGGPDFFSPVYVFAALFPAIFGLAGMYKPNNNSLLLLTGAYFCCYMVGLTGFQLAGRFLMPLALVLQIGLAVYILGVAPSDRRRQIVIGLVVGASLATHAWVARSIDITAPATAPGETTFFEAAATLTADLLDDEPVAALFNSAWPVVATRQKVLSVPWPEPMIADLAARQAATLALFAADLAEAERAAIAKSYGVRSLIASRAILSDETLAALEAQAVDVKHAGPLIRFDLYD